MEQLIREMEQYAKENHVPIINERGKTVFIDIVSQKKPNRVLEIGTAIGYSALLMANHSAADVKITSLELDSVRGELAEAFIKRSAYRDNIEIIIGDADEKLDQLQGKYDLVFIDAAKGQYLNYFNKVLPILADDGVIIADNVLFRGYVLSQEAPPRRYKTIVLRLRKYIETVMNHPDFDTKIYENGDGLAVSYHRGKKIEKA